jgi:hypothetical protein
MTTTRNSTDAVALRTELFSRPAPNTREQAIRNIYDVAMRVLNRGGFPAEADALRNAIDGTAALGWTLTRLANQASYTAKQIRQTYPEAGRLLEQAASFLGATL